MSLFTLFDVFFTIPTFIVYPMHWIDPVISFFRLSVCVSVNKSVLERLRPQFFTDFHQICMRLRNVVPSTPIVCETNRT